VSEEDQDKAISFLETLDDHDDVQHVFTNME
jgi:transcriptional/translational regulatory protein YebC/TACO1